MMKKSLPPFMMKGKEAAPKAKPKAKAPTKGKMPPMLAKKAPKRMMGGGSCK